MKNLKITFNRCLIWCGIVIVLPKVALALAALTLADLVRLRVSSLLTVTRMRDGRPPFLANPNWPLLGGALTLVFAALVSVIADAAFQMWDLAHVWNLLAGASAAQLFLGALLALVLFAALAAVPVGVQASARAISGEHGRWKNGRGPGPRPNPPDPPAPSGSPFPPTGLAPAPLAGRAAQELVEA